MKWTLAIALPPGAFSLSKIHKLKSLINTERSVFRFIMTRIISRTIIARPGEYGDRESWWACNLLRAFDGIDPRAVCIRKSAPGAG